MSPRARFLFMLAIAAFSALGLSSAAAQTPDPQGPVLVYQNIADGAVLNEIPLSIQLCFKDPINIKDLDKGGDFAFSVTQPDGIGLGHRDIFQPDGYGVAVQPGNPVGDTKGEWTFTYRVTTPDAQHAAQGTIKYTVDPNGSPAPRVSPPACVPTGGTATVSPPPSDNSATPGTSVSSSPTITATQRPSPSASPTPLVTRGPETDDNGGPDIVKIALITLGVAGGLVLLAIVGYFVRRAVGFDWHKPGSGGDSDHH